MEGRVLTDSGALDALAPEWDDLAARCDASPFATAAWLAPWWAHLGQGSLHLVEVRDRGRLVAIGARRTISRALDIPTGPDQALEIGR